MEKQDEILSVDPTITDTEAGTFPAATPEEEAAETIPQVMEKTKAVTEDDTTYLEAMQFFEKEMLNQEMCLAKLMLNREMFLRIRDAKEIDFLPLSSKDLANTPLERKALTWEAFLCFVVGGMLDISPQQYGILLMICIGFLSYYAKNSTTPFGMQFGKTTTTPVQSLISFSEAFYAFFPEITHITKFMLCYVLSWMLVLPLRLGMQIFLVLLLISAPIFYFPELVHKAAASGVHVACGSIKLPLIWFATLGAVGLSLICGFVTLLMVYLKWRFIDKGIPRVRAIEVRLDGLSEILQG